MSKPPRLPRRLLERRLSGPTRTFLLGDLEERFRALDQRAPFRARMWYWRQALGALLLPLPGVLNVRPGSGSGSLRADLRVALRGIVRKPGAVFAAVLPLGLGIGVVVTAFSILWGTVLTGLPFAESDRLVHFERARLSDGLTSLPVTPHDFLAWKETQRSFEDLGAYVEREITLPNEGGLPERRSGVAITANTFPILRVAPALGRTFVPTDEEPGAPDVILLSHGLWTARFGADPGMVGRTTEISGRSVTVVGVMPEGVGFPIAEEFWEPLRLDLTQTQRGEGRLDVFGRLREGITVDAARDEFDQISQRLAETFPATNAGVVASLSTFNEEYVGAEFTGTVYRMLVGAILLLLVCCSNVANLLLIRGSQRRRELAVRQALGATEGAIARQLVVEAGILAAVGALLGLLVAAYGVNWFNRVGTSAGVFDLPHGSASLFWWDVSLNLATLGAAAGVAAVTAVLAGLAPAVTLARGSTLGRRGSDGVDPWGARLQRGIVFSQLSLTVGLLVAAGFVAKSVVNVSGTEGRFAGEGVVVINLGLPSSTDREGYADPTAAQQFIRELEARLQADPSVTGAAFATHVPLETPRSTSVRIDGNLGEGDLLPETGVVTVSPAYFDVFGVPALEGRLFSPNDRLGAPPVALVNRSFADRHLAHRSAVGSRIRLGGEDVDEPWVEVVGVVPDLWERPQEPDREAGIYLPFEQVLAGDPMTRVGRWGILYPDIAVAEAQPGAVTARLLGSHVGAMDGSLPLRRVETMEELSDRFLGRYRVWGQFWMGFAATALLLAGFGIYGVLSYSVTLRTGEIGVRRALGASAAAVQLDVIKRALRTVTVGLAVGLVLGLVLTDAVRQVLYGVETGDPLVFGLVAVLVGAVSLIASWLPARRAARIDPRDAMRG